MSACGSMTSGLPSPRCLRLAIPTWPRWPNMNIRSSMDPWAGTELPQGPNRREMITNKSFKKIPKNAHFLELLIFCFEFRDLLICFRLTMQCLFIFVELAVYVYFFCTRTFWPRKTQNYLPCMVLIQRCDHLRYCSRVWWRDVKDNSLFGFTKKTQVICKRFMIS